MCKFLTAILAVIPLSAAAQQFPNRPIRFVMAYPPGGSSDVLARPIANERLKRDGSGDVVLQLKSPWRDGTTHLRMTPLEFMQRLAALVPRPRLHLIRFQGGWRPTPACVVQSCRALHKIPASLQTNTRTKRWRAWAGRACSSASSTSTWNTARSVAVRSGSSPPQSRWR